MPKGDSIRQFGVFDGIVPGTREFVVLNPEGAVAARAVHRLSEDQKWDTEFVSRVEGEPWDFKAKPGDDVNDDGILERADARPPHPPVEIPCRFNVRRMYIRSVHVQKFGPTKGCPGCQKVVRGTVSLCIAATHNDECRERMERLNDAGSRWSGPSSQNKNTSW